MSFIGKLARHLGWPAERVKWLMVENLEHVAQPPDPLPPWEPLEMAQAMWELRHYPTSYRTLYTKMLELRAIQYYKQIA